METASFGIVRARDSALPTLSGEVKLAVTEGLGTFWVAPRLVEFQRAHPRLIVNLMCAMQSADVLRLEADVAIQLIKPTTPDIKVVKLGRLHSMPFAGRSYIETYGTPKTMQEMANHRIVLQLAEQTKTRKLFDDLFAGIPWEGFVAMVNNTSTAHSWAIAKGAGIGWLPTYIHAIGGRFVPIELDAHFPFDIWLTYHPDAGRIPRVRRMIEWIIEAFDPRKFPWFRDEFIHPNELKKLSGGEPIVNLFEGFIHADEAEALPADKQRSRSAGSAVGSTRG
jgi:DNA-binding transcriptional LysR family regulator